MTKAITSDIIQPTRKPLHLPHAIWLLIAIVLIVAGLAGGGLDTFQRWQASRQPQHNFLASTAVTPTTKPVTSGIPTHISLDSVGISLPVIPGNYYPATKSWTLSLDSAQWATMTAQPNDTQGDTFIYAHNRYGVFHTLPNIKPGAKAVVTTANHHMFTYTYKNSMVVSPSNTSLFNYKGKPVLILQTCSGVWYQDRQLFIFDLTSVQ